MIFMNFVFKSMRKEKNWNTAGGAQSESQSIKMTAGGEQSESESIKMTAGGEQSESESIKMIWTFGMTGCVPFGQKGVDGGSMWMAGTKQTEVRLDGQCEGGLGQQREDGGGCAKDGNEWIALEHTYIC